MFYVTKRSPARVLIGGYNNRETAENNNPKANIVEDIILSHEVGFPIPDLVVKGYSKCETGKYIDNPVSWYLEDKDYSLYARSSNENWIKVATHDTFSFSRLPSSYRECIFLESVAVSNCSPRELLGILGGEVNLEPVKQLTSTSSSIYDD